MSGSERERDRRAARPVGGRPRRAGAVGSRPEPRAPDGGGHAGGAGAGSAPRRSKAARAAQPPRATYRLQMNRGFTFRDAARLVPYLDRLGVSHLYVSPILKARPGSVHGYDIVDHGQLNPEIGTIDELEALGAALREREMGLVLDIVPNHMAVGCDNAWWIDVLENGPASVHAETFDILWDPPRNDLGGKVVLPVLGAQYGEVLAAGDLTLVFDPARGAFEVRHYEDCFPVDPRTYPEVLGLAPEEPAGRPAGGDLEADLQELESLVTAFGHLPPRDATAPELVAERARDCAVHRRLLARLCERSPAVREHIGAAVAAALRPGPEGLPPLHDLLEQQAYRLAYWRVAADEINYRRFFDVNELAGLRMELPEVFAATHRLVLELVGRGLVQGLRIDHPDGLHDPLGYLEMLQRAAAEALGGAGLAEDARAGSGRELPIYLVVEKILSGDERLPESWPVHGTTGYEFAAQLTGLFVNRASERRMTALYHRFLQRKVDLDELVFERKRLITRVSLSSELSVLTNRLDQISESDPRTRDFTPAALRNALADVVAAFPVYRTYIRGPEVREEDREQVERAVARARAQNRAEDTSIFDFLRRILLLEGLDGRPEGYRRQVVDFVERLQQYTGPVMAKGLEDTSFYIYNRLLALAEVGADPRRFGTSPSALHRENEDRARRSPHGMLSTSTHDSKRSEDVRARIAVLSEVPDRFRGHLVRWSRINRGRKTRLEVGLAPDRNDELMIYQGLLGAWPDGEPGPEELSELGARFEAATLKAIREAKVHTSWINRDEAYEAATVGFVRALLHRPERNAFLADFLPFQRRVALFGKLNGLAQVAVKLLSPGVPDLYQGNELWTYALVDPDNRRPVDYDERRRLLDELLAPGDAPGRLEVVRSLLARDEGRSKLYLTQRCLELRRAYPARFLRAGYRPLETTGPRADHLFAFARLEADWAAVVVVPRLLATAGFDDDPLEPEAWRGTWVEAPALEGGSADCTDLLTSETLRAEERAGRPRLAADALLGHFPVAVLQLGSTVDRR